MSSPHSPTPRQSLDSLGLEELDMKLAVILIEFRRDKLPIFADEDAAWKAQANKDKAQQAQEYATARIKHLVETALTKEREKAFRAGQQDCQREGDPRNHAHYAKAIAAERAEAELDGQIRILEQVDHQANGSLYWAQMKLQELRIKRAQMNEPT